MESRVERAPAPAFVEECRQQIERLGWTAEENHDAVSWTITGTRGERSFIIAGGNRENNWRCALQAARR